MRVLRASLKVLDVFFTVALVALIAASVVLGVSAKRSRDAIPTVLGHKVMTVLSGSMEPAVHTGDLIIVKPLAPTDTINEGDVITFRAKEQKDMLITHRVGGVISVNGKPAAYVTKGDANESQDLNTVTRENIIGRYRWRVLYFGYVLSFLKKPLGIVLVVIVPALILIVNEFRKMWKTLEEAEAAKKAVQEGSAVK